MRSLYGMNDHDGWCRKDSTDYTIKAIKVHFLKETLASSVKVK